jgi:hypothetical protein
MVVQYGTKARKGRPLARTGTSPNLDVNTLKVTTLRLRITRSAVLTAVEALVGQNADHDVDIASTLRHAVAQPLSDEIERLEAFIAHIPS